MFQVVSNQTTLQGPLDVGVSSLPTESSQHLWVCGDTIHHITRLGVCATPGTLGPQEGHQKREE